MPNIIISDTSCLIVLMNINEIALLQKLYGSILTTPEVASEFGEPLPDWIIIQDVNDKSKQKLLEIQIDKGESSALALALEIPNSMIIIDDYKARKIAENLKIAYTGTIGIIVKAKLNGLIPSIKPILEKIKQTNFRLLPDIETKALQLAGE